MFSSNRELQSMLPFFSRRSVPLGCRSRLPFISLYFEGLYLHPQSTLCGYRPQNKQLGLYTSYSGTHIQLLRVRLPRHMAFGKIWWDSLGCFSRPSAVGRNRAASCHRRHYSTRRAKAPYTPGCSEPYFIFYRSYWP